MELLAFDEPILSQDGSKVKIYTTLGADMDFPVVGHIEGSATICEWSFTGINKIAGGENIKNKEKPKDFTIHLDENGNICSEDSKDSVICLSVYHSSNTINISANNNYQIITNGQEVQTANTSKTDLKADGDGPNLVGKYLHSISNKNAHKASSSFLDALDGIELL